MLIPVIIGITLTLIVIFIARAIGLDRDRATYTSTLIAIALFYIVFAFENGDILTQIINIFFATIFIVGALIGYKKSVLLIAWLLIGHGLFDATYHFFFQLHTPAPEWWAPLCFGIDFVLGGYLIWLQMTKPLEN